jgi:nitrogen fixation protein NifQ
MQIGDPLLFRRMVAMAATESPQPLTEALGLDRGSLERLLRRYLPGHLAMLESLPAGAGPGPDALEEPDLRAYLLECRAGRGEEEEWLAAIVARRSLKSNHLWQDLGLADRGELGALFGKHFPELVVRNRLDMKWKKFFYRALCERDGVPVCKAPNCAVCSDAVACFAPETGARLPVVSLLGMPSPAAKPGPDSGRGRGVLEAGALRLAG